MTARTRKASAAQPMVAVIGAGIAPGVRRTASGGAEAAIFPPDVPSDPDALDRFSGDGPEFVPVIGEIPADLAIDGTTEHPSSLFGPRRVRV